MNEALKTSKLVRGIRHEEGHVADHRGASELPIPNPMHYEEGAMQGEAEKDTGRYDLAED